MKDLFFDLKGKLAGFCKWIVLALFVYLPIFTLIGWGISSMSNLSLFEGAAIAFGCMLVNGVIIAFEKGDD